MLNRSYAITLLFFISVTLSVPFSMLFSVQAQATQIAELPMAVSNNAVSAVKTSSGWQLLSFNGLTKNKDWRAVTNTAMGLDLATKTPYVIDNVPFKEGRLASISATVNNKVYLFGGYTVSESHAEKSMPDVYQYDPETRKFSLFSQMLIPVDDSVALVYQNRYIYLISGWHDVGNIADVQILDTQTKRWYFGTPYPGEPVFGHAAGIVNNFIVVIDGVKVAGINQGKRQYAMSNQSFLGKIDSTDFTKIHWQKLPPHPEKAKYRAAASGSQQLNSIVFAGGSDNPYNFNGIGYNGTPSKPSSLVFSWNLEKNQWQTLTPLKQASMDHRGLLAVDNSFYLLGGMSKNQTVHGKVVSYQVIKSK